MSGLITLDQAKKNVLDDYGTFTNFERAHNLNRDTLKHIFKGNTKGKRGDALRALILLGVKNEEEVKSSRFVAGNLSESIINIIKKHITDDQINRFVDDSLFSKDIVMACIGKSDLVDNLSWLTKREFASEFVEWIMTGKIARTAILNPRRQSEIRRRVAIDYFRRINK